MKLVNLTFWGGISHQGLFCPPEDIWPRLETCLVVTTGVRGATGFYRVEARDDTKHDAQDSRP